MDLLTRLQRRLARDDGTTEVIAYVFMFAIGSMALVFAMDVLTDAQRRGSEVATAKQADQLGQLTAGLVEQAGRVAESAPNASYVTHFELPDPVGDSNMTAALARTDTGGGGICPHNASVHVHSSSERVSTSVQLGNLSTVQIDGSCLDFAGEVDTSAQAASVRYEPPAEHPRGPVIVLEPTSKVR